MKLGRFDRCDIEQHYEFAGSLPKYSMGDILLYVTKDGAYLCADCAGSKECREADTECPDDNQWYVIGADVLEGTQGPILCANCDAKFE